MVRIRYKLTQNTDKLQNVCAISYFRTLQRLQRLITNQFASRAIPLNWSAVTARLFLPFISQRGILKRSIRDYINGKVRVMASAPKHAFQYCKRSLRSLYTWLKPSA